MLVEPNKLCVAFSDLFLQDSGYRQLIVETTGRGHLFTLATLKADSFPSHTPRPPGRPPCVFCVPAVCYDSKAFGALKMGKWAPELTSKLSHSW